MKYQVKVLPTKDMTIVKNFDSKADAVACMERWIGKFEKVFQGGEYKKLDYKKLGSVQGGFVRFDRPCWSSCFTVALVENK